MVGAIAGGVIGNQFGHGFGRAAATGLGAVAGSAIGNNVEANANPPTAVPVQRCRTVNAVESRIVGYDVVYEYHGQRYTTRLPEDPGPRLAVDMRPAGQRRLERSGHRATAHAGAARRLRPRRPRTSGAVRHLRGAGAGYAMPAPRLLRGAGAGLLPRRRTTRPAVYYAPYSRRTTSGQRSASASATATAGIAATGHRWR